MEKNIIDKIDQKKEEDRNIAENMETNIIEKIDQKKEEDRNIAEDMEKNIIEKIGQKEDRNIAETPYKSALMENLEKKIRETNKLVRNQNRIKDDKREEDDKARNQKIRIVRKPKDVNIRNSKDLRKKFNQYYPSLSIPKLD